MKEKIINCPFCKTSMSTFEGIAVACPHCKQNIILEKKTTNNVEDNLYLLKESPKEKAEKIYKIGKEHFAMMDFDTAYRYALAAVDLDSNSPSISFLAYTSLSKIVTSKIENNKEVSKIELSNVTKFYNETSKLLESEELIAELESMHEKYLKTIATLNEKKAEENTKAPEVKKQEKTVEAKQTTKTTKTTTKTKAKSKPTFHTRKESLDDPEPIDFPGISEFKPIRIAFWVLVCTTALFLFYSYMAFLNPDLLGNREAFESTPLSISIIITLLGFIGVILIGVWIGYYLARKFYGVDSSEPFVMTLIRRASLIGLLICVVTAIWNGGLLLMMNSLPEFLLEGVEALVDSSEEIRALTISAITGGSLIAFLNIFHIVNHTRLMCEYNRATPRLIVSEVGGRLEIISFSILVLTGIYYLINWLWKPAIEFITFGSYEVVASVMWIVLIVSASVFAIGVILDIATAQNNNKKAS